MKNFIYIIATTLLMAVAFTHEAMAQAGGITKNGRFVNWRFPDAITQSKTVTFPTATSLAPAWVGDSTSISVGEFYTYVAPATITATRRIKLSSQSYLTAGAQLVIDAVADTTRSLIIVQPAGNDTISVPTNKHILLYYTGSKWVPVGTY
jgi:hypothetical protein